MISVEVDLKEEWMSIVTVYDNGFGKEYDPPQKGFHHHESEEAARHFKEWREALQGKSESGNAVWPRVTIELRRRYVSDWEEVT